MSNQYPESDFLFEVKYIAENMCWLDGLTLNAVYGVIEELPHQYVIFSERLGVCKVSKNRFYRLN